jgi:2,5-diketo-D-gluconate reductase A
MGRWCVQKNIVVVAKTVKKSRMEENMGIFDFALDDDDLKTLDNMTSPGWFHCLHTAHCTLQSTP